MVSENYHSTRKLEPVYKNRKPLKMLKHGLNIQPNGI